MAHRIWGNSFYNRSDKPAWHRLGINDETYHSAEEALRRVGEYDVQKFPLSVSLPDGTTTETGYYGVFREPVQNEQISDNQWRMLGAPVSNDYELITPIAAARLWDENVQVGGKPAPIETLGILNVGQRLFMTTKLPYFSVKGDECVGYLLYDNPFGGGFSAGVYTTSIRVVCQNTLTAGINGAVEKRTVTHNTGATEYIAAWLKNIYEGSLATLELMKEAFNVLADKPVSDVQVQWIADTIYTDPRQPREDDKARRPLEVRLDEWERACERQAVVRKTVVDLFKGAGVGMDTKAVTGTAFGAFNAVGEFETYRYGKYSATAEGLIDGDRAKRIRAAFDLSMNVDRYQTLDVTKFGLKAPASDYELNY